MESGLHFKLPYPFEAVYTYDTRSQYMDSGYTETLTNDKKNVILQTYLVWHIEDPMKFYTSVGDNEKAEKYLNDLTANVKNGVMGNYELSALVSTDLENIKIEEISKSIEKSVAENALKDYGIRVEKVKINRLALPTNNIESVFEQMIADREKQVTKLLHIIGDFERISDHAVNIVESAEEIDEKKMVFSEEAQKELSVLCSAVLEILNMTEEAFLENDIEKARSVEPLEQVIDGLKSKIKRNHIRRLQNNECTIENGFILADILNNLERVSDHCSNIAECVIEISERELLDSHKYMREIKSEDSEFEEKYKEYKGKYSI
jgi:regulator of protease activity HflC (stomatin/prohibitin superfamily)